MRHQIQKLSSKLLPMIFFAVFGTIFSGSIGKKSFFFFDFYICHFTINIDKNINKNIIGRSFDINFFYLMTHPTGHDLSTSGGKMRYNAGG